MSAQKITLYPGIKLWTSNGYLIVNGKHFDDFDCTEAELQEDDTYKVEGRILTKADIKDRLYDYSGHPVDLAWDGEDDE